MTDIVETPPAPVVAPFPALGSSNYNDEAYAAGVSLPGFSAGIHAIGVAAETNSRAAREAADAAVPAAATAVPAAAQAVAARDETVAARNDAVPAAEQALDAAQRAEQAAASIQDGPVVSVGGVTGVVMLKTINSTPLTGAGNLAIDNSIVRIERTSNTALTAADKGRWIDITSGTFTQTFAPAAALGDGWFCYLRNSGTGDITLDANASELIDGLTSYIMYPGECRFIQGDASALRSLVINAGTKKITSSTAFIWPPGIKSVLVDVFAPGAGGGRPQSTIRSKNTGGGGGGRNIKRITGIAAGTNITATIGAAGVGATVDDTYGTDGGNSSFGTYVGASGGKASTAAAPYIGGSGGSGETFAAQSAGSAIRYFEIGTMAAEQPGAAGQYGGGGGGGSVSAGGVGRGGGDSLWGGGGGGGGGGGTPEPGGAGGKSGAFSQGSGVSGGAGNGNNGADGNGVVAGGGGSGGGFSGTAGKGGNGGVPSGGGGGGSCGATSGNGGNGGRGEIVVYMEI